MANHDVQGEADNSNRRTGPHPVVALGAHNERESKLENKDAVHTPERGRRRFAHTTQRVPPITAPPSRISDVTPVTQAAPPAEDEIITTTMPKLARSSSEVVIATPRPEPGSLPSSAIDSTALYRKRPTFPTLPVLSSDPSAFAEDLTIRDGAPRPLDTAPAEASDADDEDDAPSELPSVMLDVTGQTTRLPSPRQLLTRLALPLALAAAVGVVWLLCAIV
jgi:hypothetical protein